MEDAIVELGAGHLHVIGELTPSLCFMPGQNREGDLGSHYR